MKKESLGLLVLVGLLISGVMAPSVMAASQTIYWNGSSNIGGGAGDGKNMWDNASNWYYWNGGYLKAVPDSTDLGKFVDGPPASDNRTINVPAGGCNPGGIVPASSKYNYILAGGPITLGLGGPWPGGAGIGIALQMPMDNITFTINNTLIPAAGWDNLTISRLNDNGTLYLNGTLNMRSLIISPQAIYSSRISLGANNTGYLGSLKNWAYGGEVIVSNPGAAGDAYEGASDNVTGLGHHTILSLQSDLTVKSFGVGGRYSAGAAYSIYLRSRGMTGGPRTLTIDNTTISHLYNNSCAIQPNPDNASNSDITIKIRGPINQPLAWETSAGTTIILGDDTLSDNISMGDGTYGTKGVISGPGKVVIDAAGSVIFKSPDNYTGGTSINRGTLQVWYPNAMPVTGGVYVAGGATLQFNGIPQTIDNLTGGDSGTSATLALGNGSVLTITTKLAPGSKAGGDCGSLIGKYANANLILGSSCNSAFDVKEPGVTQDSVNLNTDNLTLNGTLTVNCLSGVLPGTYTLFTGNLIIDNLTSKTVTNLPSGWTSSFSIDNNTMLKVTLASGNPPAATPTFTPAPGTYAIPQSVSISCATAGAVIHYTTNGTTPNTTSPVYSAPITVTDNTTINAKAYVAGGYDPSAVATGTYQFVSTFDRPDSIPAGTATIDGDLADWDSGSFIPLDQDYTAPTSYATDIAEAYYAAKWDPSGHKIYLAVKVRDTSVYLTNNFFNWGAADGLEIYIHTAPDGALSYFPNETTAQQYVMGITPAGNAAWSVLAGTAPAAVPANVFQGAGKVIDNGDGSKWLCYEAAITPYDYYGGWTGLSSVVSNLAGGQVIGLDVVASACTSDGTPTGYKSENLKQGKYNDWSKIGIHALEVAPSMSATLTLGNFTGSKAGIPVTVELRGNGATRQDNVTLAADGSFAIANIASGTYNVWIKPSHWLAIQISGVPITSGSMDLGTYSVPTNGDADGDNAITSTDLSIVLAGMGTSNAQADLNGSGAADSADLSLVLAVMDQVGIK